MGFKLHHLFGGPTYLERSGQQLVIRVRISGEAKPSGPDEPFAEVLGKTDEWTRVRVFASSSLRRRVYRTLGPRGTGQIRYTGERAGADPVWEVRK